MENVQTDEGASVLRASIIALVLGSALAVAVVLPAEYGVDPTGLGRAFGLLQLAPPVPEEAQTSVVGESTGSSQRHMTSLDLAPGDGVEFKLVVAEGEPILYQWRASAEVHFDHHGEPAGDASGYYESYAVGYSDAVQGRFAALFTGTHGWYWRNDGSDPVTLQVVVSGPFNAVVGAP